MEPILTKGATSWADSFVTKWAQTMIETNTQSEISVRDFALARNNVHTINANKIGGFDPSKYSLDGGRDYFVTPEVAQKIFASILG